jgi:hypothetical protein
MSHIITGHRIEIEAVFKDITAYTDVLSNLSLQKSIRASAMVGSREEAHKAIDAYFDELNKAPWISK